MHTHKYSARDERYLACTSFEVYMATGAVFLIGFTLAFIVSVVYHIEWSIWPASIPVLIVSYMAFSYLKRREQANKIREIDQDYQDDVAHSG
ncbi:MAG: DUF3169 family protein [Chloroflexaceae bacterium]|nr:DUF3169 family protein [Chloroflexaceae bacterium]